MRERLGQRGRTPTADPGQGRAAQIAYSWKAGSAALAMDARSLSVGPSLALRVGVAGGTEAVSCRSLDCRMAVDCLSTPAAALAVAVPGVTTIAPPTARLRVLSFAFDAGTALRNLLASAIDAGQQGDIDQQGAALADSTHLPGARPAAAAARLEDRVHHVLEPSVEQLLAASALVLPVKPFGYQLDGIAFLVPRRSAVLADEMGLGKTMQAITALRLLLRTGELSSVLLVCPKPLVTNWQRELNYWAPELPTAVIEGEQGRREWQWRAGGVPIKIANYELLQRDRDILEHVRFDLVVLDEAQRIKNRAAATHQLVCSIDRRRSWALTGTPIENSSDDLVGIFEFVAPGKLSAEMKPSRMARAAGDYILRRTKEKVLDWLPPKLARDAEVQLGPEQRESYQMAEKQGVLRLTEMGDAATIQHVFELVLRLKQICNFDPASGASTKLERLEADLEEVAASGGKALVFSQWVSTLECLAGRLKKFGPLEYHGRVPPKNRDAVIEQFRSDPSKSILLLSYGAGGVGLNLQFASYVFLFDRWWNPAVEDQAINRAHRIGGQSKVIVTRFVTADTIEERIDQVLRDKREIFDMVFSSVKQRANLGLSQQEIFGLFKLRAPEASRAA